MNDDTKLAELIHVEEHTLQVDCRLPECRPIGERWGIEGGV